MGKVLTEHCVLQMSKGNDERKYKINGSVCVCVFVCEFGLYISGDVWWEDTQIKSFYSKRDAVPLIKCWLNMPLGNQGHFEMRFWDDAFSPKLHQNLLSTCWDMTCYTWTNKPMKTKFPNTTFRVIFNKKLCFYFYYFSCLILWKMADTACPFILSGKWPILRLRFKITMDFDYISGREMCISQATGHSQSSGTCKVRPQHSELP